uniref:Uncharacterized protein n=1 Tax=Arion vulgaris TaxID=1028688 RepID=A0A0B6ZBK2_9EUPU
MSDLKGSVVKEFMKPITVKLSLKHSNRLLRSLCFQVYTAVTTVNSSANIDSSR